MLHLMFAEVAWVLVSLRTQVQTQIILDPDYLRDYLSVSYDYDLIEASHFQLMDQNLLCNSIDRILTFRCFNLFVRESLKVKEEVRS